MTNTPVGAGSPSNWVVCPQQRAAATLRLYCFPSAGVGASSFRTWAAAFPPDIEVCLVQPPGRESRWGEPAFTSIERYVPAAADAIAAHVKGPYAFFGHSLGALVSFEVARAFRRRGASGPLHLFVSAHRAPQLPNPHPELHRLSDAQLVSEIRRHYNGIPQLVIDNPELLALMLPVLRADFTTFETYRYSPESPLECPISAFGGLEDRRVSEAEMAAWNSQTPRTFRLRMMEGDHFYLQPRRDAVVSAVREDLATTRAASLAGSAGSNR